MQKSQSLKLKSEYSVKTLSDHSLFYVANSVKKILQNSTGLNQLNLQIKCSQMNQCSDQNLLKKLSELSMKQVQIVNGKNKDMPKIKSIAGIKLKTFNNITQRLNQYCRNNQKQMWQKLRVDVVCDGSGQKFTYLVGCDSWLSVKKFKIFKPMYQVLSQNDHFRIAFSRKKKSKQRVLKNLKQYLLQIQGTNQKQTRFKLQTDYYVNELYKITTNKVLQTGQTDIIKLLIKQIFENDGKCLDMLVQKVIQQHLQQLTYEVEIRFTQTAIKLFQGSKVEQIQNQMRTALDFLNRMKKSLQQAQNIQKQMQKLSI